MKRVGGILVLAALMVSLSACVWNLDESSQLGSLTVSFESGDGFGALDLSQDFQSITLVVVEASHFIRGGRTIRLGNAGFETEGPVSSQVQEREPVLAASPYAEEFQIVAVDGGLQEAIAGGFAFTHTSTSGIPQGLTVPDLIVGREYVVWIDAVPVGIDGPAGPVSLGFSVARIRSGAPTTVSISLMEDRFPQLVQTLYDRYVAPFLPPPPDVDLGQFTGFLYAGTGSADITIGGGQPQPVSLNRGWVLRFDGEEYEGEAYNIFFLGFFFEDEMGGEATEIVLSLREQDGVLEPNRTSYSLAISDDFMVLPPVGSIFEVDLYVLDGVETDYYLLPEPPPSLLPTAGFVGGSPSQGGSFTFGVTGTFEDFDLGTEQIDITNLLFSYGELLETFDDWFESEAYQIGDIGPAGGYIFYVDEANEFDWTYLEAAPVDTEWAFIPWRPTRTAFPGELSSAVGAGEANTASIIAGVGGGEYAAAFAANLSINGFDDWFLPSLGELTFMRDNLAAAGIGGFSDAYYWSSSKPVTPEDQAISLPFPAGSDATIFVDLTFLTINGEQVPLNARAIRAFSDDFEFIPPEGLE